MKLNILFSIKSRNNKEFKSTILGLSNVPKIDRKGKSITADPNKIYN
jgi:hypothetical protein